MPSLPPPPPPRPRLSWNAYPPRLLAHWLPRSGLGCDPIACRAHAAACPKAPSRLPIGLGAGATCRHPAAICRRRGARRSGAGAKARLPARRRRALRLSTYAM